MFFNFIRIDKIMKDLTCIFSRCIIKVWIGQIVFAFPWFKVVPFGGSSMRYLLQKLAPNGLWETIDLSGNIFELMQEEKMLLVQEPTLHLRITTEDGDLIPSPEEYFR